MRGTAARRLSPCGSAARAAGHAVDDGDAGTVSSCPTSWPSTVPAAACPSFGSEPQELQVRTRTAVPARRDGQFMSSGSPSVSENDAQWVIRPMAVKLYRCNVRFIRTASVLAGREGADRHERPYSACDRCAVAARPAHGLVRRLAEALPALELDDGTVVKASRKSWRRIGAGEPARRPDSPATGAVDRERDEAARCHALPLRLARCGHAGRRSAAAERLRQ